MYHVILQYSQLPLLYLYKEYSKMSFVCRNNHKKMSLLINWFHNLQYFKSFINFFHSHFTVFTMNLPCNTIGLTIVDVYVNYSTLIDGYVFNNTYEFYFHRSCTPSNSSK